MIIAINDMKGVSMEEIALVDLKPDDVGRIKEISGGQNVRKRLFELGLNRGTQVKMVKNDIGPVILTISGTKLALGRGLANKIIVQK